MDELWDMLEVAVQPVLADMERTRPGCAGLERGTGGASSPLAWLREPETGSGTGLNGDFYDEDPLVRTAVMTSRLQDLAMELFWRTWPRCPQHGDSHPLGPDVVDDQVWWTCPSSGAAVARVGHLGPS